MHDDTQELTRRAAAGDRAAVDVLLARHLPELRAFVRLRVGALLRARESNSDLVQSVCREILEHGDRFVHPDENAFRRWLYVTAVRKIQHRHEHWLADKRDAGRELAPRAVGASGDDELLFACYSRISSPSQHAIAKEENERLEGAFDRLPEEYREVITLSRIAGLSHAEIAKELDRSEGAVRMLLHRALVQMSRLMAERS